LQAEDNPDCDILWSWF